jgi:hypothetical protein
MNKELPETITEEEQVITVPVKKIVSTPTGLFDANNEPIMVDKEIVVEEEKTVKLPKRKKLTVREATSEFKYTDEWASTNKEMYSPEEYAKLMQGQQARMLGSAEERAAQEEAARRIGEGFPPGGGPPLGGPPIGGSPLVPKL